MAATTIFRAFILTLLAAFAACVLIAVFGVAGCSKTAPPAQSTARVLAAADVRTSLPGATLGDTAYAQVNSAWLAGYYAEFRAEIFRQGVVKWDDRFDCNHFASYYVALAQTKFYLANFQSRTSAQTLALGIFWYRPGAGIAGHAIVAALTERGLVFVEPQTGGELALTPAERATVYLAVL